jgi:DNA adenine methylase
MYGPFSYIGGKRALAPRIIALFPEHKAYVEPFAGGAQVFFRKQPSKIEVLNDLDREIANFYRICQSHFEELVRYLRFTVVSRAWFDLLNETDPAKLTDIQRAARHFYLAKNCYGGLVKHRNYALRVDAPPGFNPERIPSLIEETHHRLARVQIECLPYEEILARYDKPTSLFYLDPPYYQIKLYRYNLKPEEFDVMGARLAKLRGKFILSLNDVPEIRALFKKFTIRTVELAYTAQKIAGRRYREVLISNF